MVENYSRAFTTRGEIRHRIWMSKFFEIPHSMSGGIDLLDGTWGIELKCRYNKYTPTFTVHQYEIGKFREENPEQELFWAFNLYGLNGKPKRLGKRRVEEQDISSRKIWFFDWDWIKQFPVSNPETGPYVYVKRKSFPEDEEFEIITIGTNVFYFPKSCSLISRVKAKI